MPLLSERDFLDSIELCTALLLESGENPDPHLQFQHMARIWNNNLKGTGLYAWYQGPVTHHGTGGFAGESWFVPATIMIVPQRPDLASGQIHGRGVKLEDLKIKFYTELDECLFETMGDNPGIIAKLLVDWENNLKGRI